MSDFISHSREVVEKYLQTAVVLDDRAYLNNDINVEKKELVTPNARGIEVHNEPSSVQESEKIDSSHLLDAQTIINTFMKKGIICSVLKCEEKTFEAEKTAYLKLIRNADLIILDWSLFKDDGEKIIKLIGELIRQDNELHELRSIIIYTANPLESVKKRLQEELKITFEEDAYRSTSDLKFTSINIFSKVGKTNAIEFQVNFNDLIEKSIESFTETVYGIIPNVAMSSLSEIRNNTHQLLGILNKSLDIGFMSHRLLLSNKNDAREHLLSIISEEIESILNSNECCKDKFDESIGKWIDQNKNDIDMNEFEKFSKCTKDISISEFTSKWHKQPADSDNDFTLLTLVNNSYGTNIKKLTTGTILKREERKISKKEVIPEAYLLCITPRCDCERVSKSGQVFLFIKLSCIKEDKQAFNILIKENEDYVKLRFSKDLANIVQYKFKPNDKNQPVYSEFSDSKHRFKDNKENSFTWISELKTEQAQRISNEIATQISRVGLNETEYIRRWGVYENTKDEECLACKS